MQTSFSTWLAGKESQYVPLSLLPSMEKDMAAKTVPEINKPKANMIYNESSLYDFPSASIHKMVTRPSIPNKANTE
jgi:hypothetical protein